MANGMEKAACNTNQQTAMDEVLQQLHEVTAISQELIDLTRGKLGCLFIDKPAEPSSPKVQEQRDFPPLFAELRGELERVRNNMRYAIETIHSTELSV